VHQQLIAKAGLGHAGQAHLALDATEKSTKPKAARSAGIQPDRRDDSERQGWPSSMRDQFHRVGQTHSPELRQRCSPPGVGPPFFLFIGRWVRFRSQCLRRPYRNWAAASSMGEGQSPPSLPRDPWPAVLRCRPAGRAEMRRVCAGRPGSGSKPPASRQAASPECLKRLLGPSATATRPVGPVGRPGDGGTGTRGRVRRAGQ